MDDNTAGISGTGSPSTDANGARGAADLGTVWRTLIDDLPPSQRAWLTASKPVTLHEHTAIIAVADEFTRNQLEGRLRTRLEDALGNAFGTQVRIAVTVDPELEGSGASAAGGTSDGSPRGDHGPAGSSLDRPSINPSIDMSTNPLDVPTPLTSPSASKPAGTALETRLNPKYIFETFVIGSSNRFAHAAAVAVAEAPGKAYNPLLIYGDSGLGKTHLLHAIGHYVRSLFNGARVRYVSSEEFTNEFINAIRDDKAAMFQRRYRDVDVLLIDDIQFLEGKIQTQEEFFHTFNTLHNANKQIVITSDRAPKRLEALEDRLRNRFEWGLITDVQPPDLETRIAILRKKVKTDQIHVPDEEVLSFVAGLIASNIRELEGALTRVVAYSSLTGLPLTSELAQDVLKDVFPPGETAQVSIRRTRSKA